MKGQRPHRAEHRVPLVGRALAIAKATPEGYSVHGFRSSFKHPAAECTDFDTWVSEKALAGDETRPHTHQRGDLFAQRHQLMTAWTLFAQALDSAADRWQCIAPFDFFVIGNAHLGADFDGCQLAGADLLMDTTGADAVSTPKL
jgi:hypothetical protein